MPLRGNPLPPIAPFYIVMGRLKTGVTFKDAQVDLDAIGVARAGSDRGRPSSVRIELLRDTLYGWIGEPLATITGAVLVLVLVVFSNVCGLLLARSAARGRELSLRAALGAGPGRRAHKDRATCSDR
jgi:putative ABC transport system permease protein